MARYRMKLEYDGAAFEGWQVQREGTCTVQGCLERALLRVTGRAARVRGSGRTDTGVHAQAQVASFELETEMTPERLQRALNGVLPRELAVLELVRAAADFDALRRARSKRYCYRIWNGPVRSPLRAARFHHVPRPLDLDAMARAGAVLVGEHDFRCFQAAGSDARSSVRRIRQLTLSGAARAEIALTLVGSGFLRHMVRNVAGTLIEVGLGRRAADTLGALLAARDRRLAGPTAPAHALTLVDVEYASGLETPDPGTDLPPGPAAERERILATGLTRRGGSGT